MTDPLNIDDFEDDILEIEKYIDSFITEEYGPEAEGVIDFNELKELKDQEKTENLSCDVLSDAAEDGLPTKIETSQNFVLIETEKGRTKLIGKPGEVYQHPNRRENSMRKVSFTDVNKVIEFDNQQQIENSGKKFHNKKNSNNHNKNFSTRSNSSSKPKNPASSIQSSKILSKSSKDSLDTHRKSAFSDIKTHLNAAKKTSPKTSPRQPRKTNETDALQKNFNLPSSNNPELLANVMLKRAIANPTTARQLALVCHNLTQRLDDLLPYLMTNLQAQYEKIEKNTKFLKSSKELCPNNVY